MRRGDEILLVHQGPPGGERFWSLPGGLLADGELERGSLHLQRWHEDGMVETLRPT